MRKYMVNLASSMVDAVKLAKEPTRKTIFELRQYDNRIHIEDVVGIIPSFFDPFSDLPTSLQIHNNYQHGGGWRPNDKWSHNFDKPEKDWEISYPEDDSLGILAVMDYQFGDRVAFFRYGIVAIVHKDGTTEIARVD